MALPPLAPFPPATARSSLGSDEWNACLDAWITLSEAALRLPLTQFKSAAQEDGPLVAFLVSLYQQSIQGLSQDKTLDHTKIHSLQKLGFSLTKRIFTELDSYSKQFLTWEFLSSFCNVHLKSSALRKLIKTLWSRKLDVLTAALQFQKDDIIRSLESSKTPPNVVESLRQLASLVHASPDIGSLFMTGSDFLDSLSLSYPKSTDDQHRKSLTSITALGLESLILVDKPNVSLLSDHIYSLKAQADRSRDTPSLLSDVVTNTSFLTKLQLFLTQHPAERLSKLTSSLKTYHNPTLSRPRPRVRRPLPKGKSPQHPDSSSLHIHRTSLISQIQDLFPDLGAGFILKALDHYNDDIERLTSHLLDDSLPPHLSSLNHSSPLPSPPPSPSHASLIPKSTPYTPFIPDRHTAFPDDLPSSSSLSTLHIGKSDKSAPPSSKAAILSALAAFDSDDDERDDTYDVDDVGGTVDTTPSAGQIDEDPSSSGSRSASSHDATLFALYRSNPELFGRTFDIRRGQARAALKRETGLTDEAIEGWAIMLMRDPRRRRRLEESAAGGDWDGRQRGVERTAYREGEGEETEGEESGGGGVGENGRGRGWRGRGRGRGRGGGGRGRGDVAGASGDPATAAAQRRKEASKGSRANHNRRDQRARKMARGGL